MRTSIRISREPEPRNADEKEWILAQSYASLDDDSLIRAVLTDQEILIRSSADNGRTWPKTEVVARKEPIDTTRVRTPYLETFYLDADNGLLVLFLAEHIHAVNPNKLSLDKEPTEYADAVDSGPRTRRLFYQISRDGGRSWGPRQPIIEKGPEYGSEHWARDVWCGRSSLTVEGRAIRKLPDGTIVAPCYLWPSDEHLGRIFQEEGRPRELWDDAKYYMHTVCLLGRWRKDLSGFEWESGGPLLVPGGYTTAGTCGSDEPTIAFLDDGRWLAVVRTSTSHVQEFRERNLPALRYGAISTDQGRSWQQARPLAYDNGRPVFSPSAYSEFIRASKNGKWYWIGNLLDNPTYGNCDPRYPLQIAELDEATLSLKRNTVTVIEDKAPDDSDHVRFSNFRVYEERHTKDLILLMTKSYCELQEGWQTLPRPRFRYRICLTD